MARNVQSGCISVRGCRQLDGTILSPEWVGRHHCAAAVAALTLVLAGVDALFPGADSEGAATANRDPKPVLGHNSKQHLWTDPAPSKTIIRYAERISLYNGMLPDRHI